MPQPGARLSLAADGRDLGLRKHFVFLEVALVGGLNMTPILGGKILVQYMGVVEIPHAAAGRAQKEKVMKKSVRSTKKKRPVLNSRSATPRHRALSIKSDRA